MTMVISDIRSPRFASIDQTVVALDVLIEGETDWATYIARPSDPYGGAELFHRAIAGDFGTVAPYVAPPPPEPAPPTVPEFVSMRQARLALHASSLLDAVDAAIAQGDGAGVIEWEYATELRRDHPLVAQLGQALELSEADIDALFITASTL